MTGASADAATGMQPEARHAAAAAAPPKEGGGPPRRQGGSGLDFLARLELVEQKEAHRPWYNRAPEPEQRRSSQPGSASP